jgi:hypothetical protein
MRRDVEPLEVEALHHEGEQSETSQMSRLESSRNNRSEILRFRSE